MNRIAFLCVCVISTPVTLLAGDHHCQSCQASKPIMMPCETGCPTHGMECQTCPDVIGVTCPPWSQCEKKSHCKHGISSKWCKSCVPACSLTWCIKTDICCLDNTCQMPPHYAYRPACHGHYYFAPYNYCTALKQKAYTKHQNLDPRFPYTVSVFDHVYGEVIGDREETVTEDRYEPEVRLPNLQELVSGN